MINTFTASAKRFDTLDLSKVGTGTGIARYGHGIYFGNNSVAQHYKSNYKDLSDADGIYTYNGKTIAENSLAHKIASLVNKIGIEAAKESVKNDKNSTKCLSMLTDQFTKKDFGFDGGILYEAKIPHVTLDDLKDWNSDNVCERAELANLFYDKFIDTSSLDLSILNDLDIDLEDYDYPESFSDLSTILFDAAYEDACEELPSSIGEYEMREVWDAHLRSDIECSDHTDDFDQCMSYNFIDTLTKLMPFTVEFDKDCTWGDIYQNLSSALNNISENKGPQLASEFLSKDYKINGFIADAMYGNENSKEIIIIDNDIIKEIKIKEISQLNNDHSNDHSNDYDAN